MGISPKFTVRFAIPVSPITFSERDGPPITLMTRVYSSCDFVGL
jgi:hypothetical protein